MTPIVDISSTMDTIIKTVPIPTVTLEKLLITVSLIMDELLSSRLSQS